jgi:hypothetical protein
MRCEQPSISQEASLPKPSRFSAIGGPPIKQIALRIRNRMKKLGYTAQRLSQECDIAGGELCREAEPPGLSANRITKILMNCQERPGSSAASVVSHVELAILASALKCAREWLSLQGTGEDPVVWNLLSETERCTQLLHLLEEYEDRSCQSLVWSEYPLCSFTSEEYMLAFHQSHFAAADALGVTTDKRCLVDFFNRTGRARRRRALQPNGTLTCTNLVYESEIQRIAAGVGVYETISRQVRKRSFEHLLKVIANPALKMNFVIIDYEKLGNVRMALRDYETVGVTDELFSLWSYHSGNVGWSENPKQVARHRQLLLLMRQHAICKDNEETAEYLKGLPIK